MNQSNIYCLEHISTSKPEAIAEKNTNKSKLLFGIGTSILFVVLGIYIYTTKFQTIDSSYSNFRKIVGIACIVFFGITGLIGIKKIVSK